MDKFKFHGKLYEVANETGTPRRVLTNVSPEIKNLDDSTTLGYAQINEENAADGSDSQQVIKLTFDQDKLTGPQGPQGLTGPAPEVNSASIETFQHTTENAKPKISITQREEDSKLDFNFEIPHHNFYINSVATAPAGGNAAVSIRKFNPDTGIYDPQFIGLNFSIPKGDTGHTPMLTIESTETLLPGTNARVEFSDRDVNNNGDRAFRFYIPRGDKGDRGEEGKPFVVAKTYASVEAMKADYSRIAAGDYVVIAADPDTEETARLYHRPYQYGVWPSDDERNYKKVDPETGAILEELDFIGDFSGAKGARSIAVAGDTETVNSNQLANVSLAADPVYDTETDTWTSTFDFEIPKGTPAQITNVSVNSLNSNQNPTVTSNSTYNSNTDTNDTTISLGIPKGASSKILPNPSVTTLESSQNATASISTIYNSSTDTYDSTLSFGIPHGEKGDKGDPPTLSIGTVTDSASGAPAEASITGSDGVYTLNLVLPRGRQGIDGQLASIENQGSGSFVSSLTLGTTPDVLVATKSNITDNDLPAAISASKINGELSTDNIPNLPASKINSGIFDAARIPDISVDKITGTLPVTKGGTGGTTAADARTNLEVYSTTEVDSLLDNYSTTLEMNIAIANHTYSKSETYTKTEVDAAIDNKKTDVTVLNGIITIE